VAIVRPFLGTQLGGDIVQINAQGLSKSTSRDARGGCGREERPRSRRHHRANLPSGAADLPLCFR